MRKDGESQCGAWAKGRKSMVNGGKGGRKPIELEPEEKQIAREIWFSTEYATVDDAAKAIKKALGKRAPRRTTLYKMFGSPYVSRRR